MQSGQKAALGDVSDVSANDVSGRWLGSMPMMLRFGIAADLRRREIHPVPKDPKDPKVLKVGTKGKLLCGLPPL